MIIGQSNHQTDKEITETFAGISDECQIQQPCSANQCKQINMNDHFKMKTTKNFLPRFVYANSQETNQWVVNIR